MPSLQLDVSATYDVDTKRALARRLGATYAAVMQVVRAGRLRAPVVAGVARDWVKIEFTQHSGDEMYHPQHGGFNREWDPGEA